MANRLNRSRPIDRLQPKTNDQRFIASNKLNQGGIGLGAMDAIIESRERHLAASGSYCHWKYQYSNTLKLKIKSSGQPPRFELTGNEKGPPISSL